MKKKKPYNLFILIILSLNTIWSSAENTQSVNYLWEKVAEEKNNDLPQSAISTLSKIISIAQNSKNDSMLIRAVSNRIEIEENITQENQFFFGRQLENEATHCPNPVEQAYLYSQAADYIRNYYLQNLWRINEHPNWNQPSGDSPDEWNKSHFIDTIYRISTLSYAADTLQKISSENYETLFSRSDIKKTHCPTLYDFFLTSTIQRLKEINFGNTQLQMAKNIVTLYDTLITFNKQKRETEAYIYNTLQKYQFSYTEGLINGTTLLEHISDLEHTYQNTPYIADIILKKVDYYMNLGNRTAEDTAYTILKKEIENTPFQAARTKLQQRLKEMTRPAFYPVSYWNSIHSNPPKGIPHEKENLYFSYRNLDSLVISFYTLSKTPTSLINQTPYPNDTLLPSARLKKHMTVTLNNTYPYRTTNNSTLLPALPVGLYQYEIKAYSPDSTFTEYYLYPVSNLASAARRYQNGDLNIWVTTAKEGKPIHKAHLLFYRLDDEGNPIKDTQLETNKNGLCTYQDIPENTIYYRICHKNDTISPLQRLPYYYRGNQEPNIRKEQERRLYLFTDRGIYRPGDILYFKGILVKLNTTNDTIIQNTPIKISLYNPKGNLVAEKMLETDNFGSVNGTFQIPQENDNDGYYRLETETGSTTVRVEHFKEPTFEITFSGDTINFLPGEEVYLQGHSKYNSGQPLQNATYEFTTTLQTTIRNGYYRRNEQQISTGKGTCNENGTFPIRFQTQPDNNKNNILIYKISGTITDSRGETQPFEKQIKIGRKQLSLQGEIQNLIDNNKLNKNEGLHISIKGINLNNKQIPVHGRIELFHITKNDTLPLYQAPFDENTLPIWNGTRNLPSGNYLLKATGYTQTNDTAVWQRTLILYGEHDKRPPVHTPLWVVENKIEIMPDSTISVIVGSTGKTYILYELFGNKGLIDRKIIHLSNENREIKIPYDEQLNEGGAILFTRMQNRKIFQKKINLKLPKPMKYPHIKWESWRNKLVPGQQDSISLRVTDKYDRNIEAELLATMCDYSLYSLYPRQWILNDGQRPNNIFVPEFNEWRPYYPMPVMFRSAVAKETNIELENTVATTATYEEEKADNIPPLLSQKNENNNPEQNTIRSNFASTAFFYPTLRADEKGTFNFTYNIPDALTKWYLRILASTKNGLMQQSSQYIITQKELMVQPLLPPFIREEDSVKIRTSITNLLPYEQTINFSAEFFDPKSKTTLFKQEQNQITISPLGEIVANIPLCLKNYTGRIGCRIKATGTQHTDGIEDYIEILPRYITVQEGTSTKLPAREKWAFECASKNGTPSEIKIKICSDLRAYAIQAIPELSLPQNNDAVGMAATLYSATIAQYLLSTYPEIATTIKNPIFTQPNYAHNLQKESIEHLQTLQKENGGWPWFKGMPSNIPITLKIVRHMAQLTEIQMTNFTEKERNMLIRALKHLDQWIKTHYKTIKNKEKYTLEYDVLEYLYIRTQFRDIPEQGDSREAIRYFTELARKQWRNKKIDYKIMTYQLMRANGDKKTCDQITHSIKEYPLPKDIRQATLLLKFYGETNIEEEQTKKLIHFILNHKRYNTWRTPSETMDAIYALFEYDKNKTQKTGQFKITGIETMTEKRNVPPLTIDSIYLPFGIEGTKTRRIWIENTSDIPLWISATRIFNESLESITPYDNGISIERTYFREQPGEQEHKLLPITEGDTINIGEHITVRLKINSKNEKSFVRIRDHFPANLINDGTLSGSRYNGNTWVYNSQTETYKNLYIEQLKSGTSIFEYKLYASFSGICRSGLAEVESLYAEEAGGHGKSTLITVE